MQARKSILVLFCFLFCFVISIAPVDSTMTFKMKQRWAHLIFLEDAEKVLLKPLNLQKATLKYLNDNSIREIHIFLK